MGEPGRKTLLGLALILLVAAGAVPVFQPTVCTDGCDEGNGAACADCPSCAPTRAPVVLAQHESGHTETVSPHECLDPLRPSRVEDRDVFHVPRRLA